jgi:Zn-dependent protease
MSSQPAFRLFGFPVHVRPGFYMFMVLVVLVNGDPKFGLWLAGFMAGLTLLHELGHAFAARATGAHAEISLDFLAGYASFVPTRPLKRWERAGISFAGPAVQIAVSVTALVAMGVSPVHPGFAASDAAKALWWAGPVIGLFNLLPVLPFDGGNIVAEGVGIFFPKKSRVIMLYASLVITVGGGLWLLSQPRWRQIAIYAVLFPLMAQVQMLRAHRQRAAAHRPSPAMLAEAAAWYDGDLSGMGANQLPSPWYRAHQQLTQGDPDTARALLLDAFADRSAPQWVAPEGASERTLEPLVALLPQPLPIGNVHAEHVLTGVLLRLGNYGTAAHYAADSYRRSPSPVSAMAVARSAAALDDRETAIGWLRAAEHLADPAWFRTALHHGPELDRLIDSTATEPRSS